MDRILTKELYEDEIPFAISLSWIDDWLKKESFDLEKEIRFEVDRTKRCIRYYQTVGEEGLCVGKKKTD